MLRLNKLQNYILTSIGGVFIPIFFSIFFITSIFIFLRISAKTTFLRINFIDMLEFYIYSLPEVLTYILPISFFSASVIALGKLSFDLELIVVFALGASTHKIMKPVVYGGLIIALTSLVLSFIVLPQARYKIKEFLYKKESTTQLNLKPSEFGQKFGDYFLFVKERTGENSYKNIVVFNEAQKMFIKADGADVQNQNNIISLVLKRGQAYIFSGADLKKIFFEKMSVNQQFEGAKLDFLGTLNYWVDMYHSRFQWEIFLQILVAVLPIISYFLIAALGIYNPRYDKNCAVALIIVCFVAFFYLVDLFGKSIGNLTLIVLPLIWISLSYVYYRKKLKVY